MSWEYIMVTIIAAASWLWSILASLTFTHWLLIAILIALAKIGGAINRSAEMLSEKLDPIREHFAGIEDRRGEGRFIGDLMKAGAAGPEDVDRLNELDAEDRS